MANDLNPMVVDVELARSSGVTGDVNQVSIISSDYDNNTWLVFFADDAKQGTSAALSDDEALLIVEALIRSVNRKGRKGV
jgi:hypothetical protein